MHKRSQKNESGGELEVFEDLDKGILLLRPQGVINPTLLQEDLSRAKEFAQKVDKNWIYVTNTEEVRLVNPFNLLYLKEIKKLKKLQQIIIYAPGLINRILIKLAGFIIRPDQIIKHPVEFERFLARNGLAPKGVQQGTHLFRKAL